MVQNLESKNRIVCSSPLKVVRFQNQSISESPLAL